MRRRYRDEAIRRDVESHRTTDPLEREVIDQDIDAYKADVFAEAGDGVMFHTLAPAEPGELYEELEHDEERPRELAR
jgi:hypothetical protein